MGTRLRVWTWPSAKSIHIANGMVNTNSILMKVCSVVSRAMNGAFLTTSLTKSFLVITTQSSAGTSMPTGS